MEIDAYVWMDGCGGGKAGSPQAELGFGRPGGRRGPIRSAQSDRVDRLISSPALALNSPVIVLNSYTSSHNGLTPHRLW